MHGKNIYYFVLGTAIAATGLWAVAVEGLSVFKAGDPIKSSEINQNFSILKSAIEAPVGSERLADNAVTLPKLSATGTASDGKVLKVEDGKLAWSDDLVSDAVGLAKPQAPGSNIPDGSITTNKLADGAVTTAKLGSAAVTAAKVSDGAIGTNKLADGAVTSSKLSPKLKLLAPDAGIVIATNDYGVTSESMDRPGVYGISTNDVGVLGFTHGRRYGVHGQTIDGVGVFGESVNANGVTGNTINGNGVGGRSHTGTGVSGLSISGIGVKGVSTENFGVMGQSTHKDAIYGISTNAAGIYGQSQYGSSVIGIGKAGYAAEFNGGRFGSGICYFAGGSGWSCTSDKNAKENFKPINSVQILEALGKMPIATWNMKGDKSKTRHLGPTAQDFKAAFGLGNDEKTITTSDAQGVAMAAIQGLYLKNQKLEAELSELKKLKAELSGLKTLANENKWLRVRLSNLEGRMTGVEKVNAERAIQIYPSKVHR